MVKKVFSRLDKQQEGHFVEMSHVLTVVVRNLQTTHSQAQRSDLEVLQQPGILI